MKEDRSPEALAEALLGRLFADLEADEQHVLQRVLTHQLSLEPDEEHARRSTWGERMADRVAAFGGSWTFILGFSAVLLAWMLINSRFAAGLGLVWDQYPFIFLNLMLSTVAALQAPIILMSQNRQAIKDRIWNRHDYEVNLRTTVEILRLHRKIDLLSARYSQTWLHASQREMADLLDEADAAEAGGRPAG